MSTKEETPKTAAEVLEGALTFVRRSLMFWKRSTLVFLVVALAAIPGVFLKARIYKSETVVLYQENIKAEALTGGENGDNARRVGARLKETLLSRASLEPIVKSIPRYNALAERRGMVDAVDELRGHISFKAREGDTFEIGYEAPNPQEAQDVTRRLGDLIVEEAAKQRNEQSKATRDYLEAQSKQNKQKTDEAQAALSSFLTLHPEFYRLLPPGAGGTAAVPGGPIPTFSPIPTAPPGTKDPVLFQMEAEARSIERQLRAAKEGTSAPTPAAPPHEESQEVKDARKDLEEKQRQFTDQHPDVVSAKRRLAAALAADAKRAPPTPTPAPAPASKMSEAEREQLEARLRDLRVAIGKHRSGHPATPPPPPVSASAGAPPVPTGPPTPASVALEVEFRRLQREVDSLKENQRQLDDKLFKAGLTAGASVNDRNIQVKILDQAYLPVHPSSKPRSTMLAMYLAAAFIMAALVALVSARLDDRIHAKNDLETLDILPVVGVIPRSGMAGTKRRHS
ncbi:MAG: hypothetical protein JST00_19310 [Deltaproteobacteria bacterium]|nr:hypothetical protein [Deltaproteobacteria bacterium]